jgi:hypothetical protein
VTSGTGSVGAEEALHGYDSRDGLAARWLPLSGLAFVVIVVVTFAAVAFSALAFLICATSAPDRTCSAGQAAEAGSIFDACAVLSPLALVAAAFASLACRSISSKIAAFFLYGGAAVPVFIGLAHAGAPCTFA